MGIDWDDLWDSAKDKLEDTWEDVKKTGVPALQASAEQWALDVLNKQHEETKAALEAGVQDVMDRPAEQGTFGWYLQNELVGPLLKSQGGAIILVLGAAVTVGLLLRR